MFLSTLSKEFGEGGDPAKQQCGWLADKYCVSQQVYSIIADKEEEKGQSAIKAVLDMEEIDILLC